MQMFSIFICLKIEFTALKLSVILCWNPNRILWHFCLMNNTQPKPFCHFHAQFLSFFPFLFCPFSLLSSLVTVDHWGIHPSICFPCFESVIRCFLVYWFGFIAQQDSQGLWPKAGCRLVVPTAVQSILGSASLMSWCSSAGCTVSLYCILRWGDRCPWLLSTEKGLYASVRVSHSAFLLQKQCNPLNGHCVWGNASAIVWLERSSLSC